jgi:hypothetical protein
VIWIVTDVSEEAGASYLERYGIDFGWVTNDSDNAAGSNAVLTSGLVFGAPWVAVIRASDMSLYAYDDPWTGNVDIVATARALADD